MAPSAAFIRLKHHKSKHELKNIGAKVLSARLAKVLNILTTSLTTSSCNAREHVAKSGRLENNQEIAEVRGNYLNFKQSLAEEEKFVIKKVTESQPLFSK